MSHLTYQHLNIKVGDKEREVVASQGEGNSQVDFSGMGTLFFNQDQEVQHRGSLKKTC